MGQAGSREDSGPLNLQSIRLSVVIPALNEAGSISSTIESVRRAAVPPVEIIVVDGGSNDGTPTQARKLGAKVVQSERGRGKQLNAGWRAAQGDWCLFLHADSQLPPQYDALIASALQRTQSRIRSSSRSRWAQAPGEALWRAGRGGSSVTCHETGTAGCRDAASGGAPGAIRQEHAGEASRCNGSDRVASQATPAGWGARSGVKGCRHASLVAWGAFKTIRTDLRSPVLRELLAAGVELRTRLRHQPYGDQAIFIRRDVLQATGGYREWPLLEDLELVQRLAAQAGPPAIVNAPVFTSGRRWRELGFFRTAIINQGILLAFAAGVPAETLGGWYRNAKRHTLAR
ncbi:hypothetical protein HYH02_013566 [Chlamydomonas schloesseri]|uniref:Glycosyltransferase 2-like domain-containing protein n=1 Tax=Chlamydomonas schloesseri TaxID=2026947 RepID=A0A835VYW6_9CHLO|nr:hypothetical protein HYH02_013566 [Chlamydomonas schloesseri]|eukprot:KAG2430724.1 hypothetical protein HYH02_013566 [Chlamydomonas schloesseri]